MKGVTFYRGIENKKVYVVGTEPEELMKAAKGRLKKSASSFDMTMAYVVGDELFLDDPQVKNQKTVWAVYTK